MDGLRTARKAARESGLPISQVKRLAISEGIGVEVCGTDQFLFTKEDVVLLSHYEPSIDETIPCHQDKEWLFDRHWTQMKTLRNMAVEAGVHHNTITRWMNKLKVPVRR